MDRSVNEDSFRVSRKVRALIDSDSEEEDNSPSASNLSDDLPENQDSDAEYSFGKGLSASSMLSESHKKHTARSGKIISSQSDIVDTTDDESQNSADAEFKEEVIEESSDEDYQSFAPGVEDEDIIESSDEDNHVGSTPNSDFSPEAIQTAECLAKIKESPDKNEEQEEDKIEGDSDSSAQIISATQSPTIVDISSEEEQLQSPVLKQLTMKSFLSKTPTPKPEEIPSQVKVSQEEYQEQLTIVRSLETELLRVENTMRVVKLETLPDKGKSIKQKAVSLETMLKLERRNLQNMVVDTNGAPATAKIKVDVAWNDIQAAVEAVGPKTFGEKGIARFNAEKQLAVETLDHLHKSLDSCPTEKDFADDPKYLKLPLMPHQKRALAWLLWREKQKPSGGLLADDMGLGKTLTMISLIMKSKELNLDDVETGKENYRDKYPGGTLVVCPASLINQWSGEIESKTKRGLLSVEVYHGAKRETKAKRLAEHDVVITTYGLVPKEGDKNGTLFRVRWRRIILDEAHQIRNHKSQTAEAVFRLSGKSRWALTGTPVHNKELDMYAVLKFLRCAPFDDLQVWKRWIGDKSTGGTQRLHAVISTLMLRRTKAELMEKGTLENLPDRTWELITIKLEKDEMDVYQRVLIFSRTLFAQFLHQRAEKSQDAYDLKFTGGPPDPNGEYFKMRNKLLKINRVKEIQQHHILVLLLRLRQICCHPYLIHQMLQGDEDLGEAQDYEESEEMNLLDQLDKLKIDDEDEYDPAQGLDDEKVGLKESSKGFLNPSNPVFRSDRASTKIKTLIKLLREKISTGDKAIVVSQWTSLLELIASYLKEERIAFDSLTGKTIPAKRMAIVDNFNSPDSNTRVLLLSLTAGGVGLNLVGANHLFLLDLHWNPQLESQAQDRIYRMGQKKPIYVYKLMAADTIEERIKHLQEKKLEIADSMLTGSKRVINSKLSLQDLKMLFEFK